MRKLTFARMAALFMATLALGGAARVLAQTVTMPLGDRKCRQASCNTMEDKSWPGCGQWCRFDQSGSGNVIWCKYALGDTCEVITPIESNGCTGYCVPNGEIACPVTWSKCLNPS